MSDKSTTSDTAHGQLSAVASRLFCADHHSCDQPDLLILRRSSGGTGFDVESRPLLGPDPVAELIGLRADRSWVGVGVRAPASSRRVGTHTDAPCSLVHLLEPSGISVTHLRITDDDTIELGPDAIVREGRIPDACRRMFNLPTPAPPQDMSEFVLDAWLAQVLRAALLSPGLTWPEIVRLSFVHHLGAIADSGFTPSPASMARALLDSSITLDWHRYRSACVMLGGCPVSELTAPQIDWMDTGMFARWTHGSLPCTSELLDLLEPTLEPTAFDRLWATISLARPNPGPSGR
jgi:hypothetical protein